MFSSGSKVAHRETISLIASPEQVREFIMTPERILDYYPSPIEGGVIEAGRCIYCRGKSGVSLLEIVPEQSNEQQLVVKVTTATQLDPPFTEDRIRAATTFIMIEDWEMERTDRGTTLTKTWRDIKKIKMKLLPMATIVRRSAKAETEKLKKAWDRAARPERD